MNKKILLLTLVHPDFLPPVYAVAQVLRDLKFDIHILTFDSFVPAKIDIGNNIELETIGRHYDANATQRMSLRNKFAKRAKQLADELPIAIICFCPFSLQCGLRIKKKTPLVYIALEIADFKLSHLLHSPLSNIRNYFALENIHKADLVATPSVQRSAWLAGRCHLNFMPYTILNTAYLPKTIDDSDYETFAGIVPQNILDKKIILYTGAVNSDLCIMELVRAFDIVNDPGSALIITGVKENEYCDLLRHYIDTCKSKDRIKTFPYLTRKEMLSLQSNAHIGACLVREFQNDVKSKMMAPNKVGEYLAKGLYILGISTEYLMPFKIKGLASLADSDTPRDVSKAIKNALSVIGRENYKENIQTFVKNEFCMQEQLKPVIKYINEIISVS